MFDDPMKELNRLNAELLAEEEPETEEWLDEDDDLADIKALLDGPKNYANGYGGAYQNFETDYRRRVTRQLMEEPEDSYDVPGYGDYSDEDRAVYRDTPRKTEKKKKKEKGIGGLVLLAVLELAAILGILIYWVVWLW